MSVSKRPILSFIESEIADAEVDFRMETWDQMYDEKPTREQILDDIYRHSEVLQVAWDDLTDFMTEEMQKRNPGGYWKAEVKGFGWMKRDGYKFFRATKGLEFFRAILPNTDNQFRVYADGKRGFAINNFHHDSPTGEWYYVRPATQKEIDAGHFY